MTPKGRPSAKARAEAKALAAKNRRRTLRRAACALLNDLASELHVAPNKLVDPQLAASADVESLVRVLERRVDTAPQKTRLRTSVKKFLGNGGVFSAPLLEDDDFAFDDR